jgi:hypothetical protein
MKISIYAPYAKEVSKTARQHSFCIILHPERIVGNSAGIRFRAPAQAGGSMPIRSFTADRMRCLQPR